MMMTSLLRQSCRRVASLFSFFVFCSPCGFVPAVLLAGSLALIAGCGDETSERPVLIGKGVVGVHGGRLSTPPAPPSDTTQGGDEGTGEEPDDSVFTADIPDGAVPDGTELSVGEAAADDPTVRDAPEILGPAYQMGPANTAFKKKVKLHIKCKKNTRPLVASTKLALSRLKDGAWQTLEGAAWNADTCEAEALTEEAGTFGLVPENPVQALDDVVGTDFSVGSVRVQIAAQVQGSIAVAADGIRMEFLATGNDKQADVVLSGLRPHGDVFVFDGTYDNRTAGKSDAGGSFSYSQTLGKARHQVWVQPVPATIYLSATGGGCTAVVGSWNNTSKTCTLTRPQTTGIQINGDGVTLDCALNTITGDRTGTAVVVNANSTRVKNCRIQQVDVGILVNSGKTSTIAQSNRIVADVYGVYVTTGATGTVVRYNSISGSAYGVRTQASLVLRQNDITSISSWPLFSSLGFSADSQTTPLYGNYWGRSCAQYSSGWFVAGVHSNRTDVVDHAPYGVWISELSRVYTAAPTGCASDADRDGWATSAAPILGQDCSDTKPGCWSTCTDPDNDGWCVGNGGDCDESAALANTCHNTCSTRYWDYDGDGYGAGSATAVCGVPGGWVTNNADCEPTIGAINPSTVWYLDGDGDGYSPGDTWTQCWRLPNHKLASELTSTSIDCDDSKNWAYPGAEELPGTNADEDCDGSELCFLDYDRDGSRRFPVVIVPTQTDFACSAAEGHATSIAPWDCHDDKPGCWANCETDSDGDGWCPAEGGDW